MVDNNFSTYDDNNDGIDDDYDRDPGNETESESFSKIYDPISTDEYGDHRLSPQNLIQKQYEEMRANQAAEQAERDGENELSGVHFFPDLGKFIIPKENTWADHAQLVQDDTMRLNFNTGKYIFDKIIAEIGKLDVRELSKLRATYYEKWFYKLLSEKLITDFKKENQAKLKNEKFLDYPPKLIKKYLEV